MLLALQSDGKIIVAGQGSGNSSNFLARLNSKGQLDSTFGAGGLAPLQTCGSDAIALRADGKILVAGTDTSKVSATGNSTGFGLVGFNTDGSIDTTFGTRGGAITGFPKTTAANAFAVTLQPNGDIVAAGQAGNNNPLSEAFALARYVGDGKLDSTFGNGGRVTTSFGSNAGDVHYVYSASERREDRRGGYQWRNEIGGGSLPRSVAICGGWECSRNNEGRSCS
jgi:uncharacterized delta-60 repeat protein